MIIFDLIEYEDEVKQLKSNKRDDNQISSELAALQQGLPILCYSLYNKKNDCNLLN